MNRRIRLQRCAPQNREEWQRLYYQHQQYRMRRRLKALYAIWEGQGLKAVAKAQHIHYKTLIGWLDDYLDKGFKSLLAPQTCRHTQRLSETRQKVLRYIVLHRKPVDYGIGSYQWTAPRVQMLLQKKWDVKLGLTRIYELFHEWGLSHQRVHRDYGPSNAKERADYVAGVNTALRTATPGSALVCMDEFALQSIPDTHYAWAPRNSKPTIPSDEKKQEENQRLFERGIASWRYPGRVSADQPIR